MKKTVAAASILILGLLGTSSQTSADIVNGGFVWNNLSQLPGWTIESSDGGKVVPIGESSQGIWSGAWPDCHVSDAGSGGGNPVAEAGLAQTFSAVAGQSLVFDYYVGALDVSQSGGDQAQASVWASLSGSAYSAGVGLSNPNGDWAGDWATYAFPAFTSDGSYTIDFQTNAFVSSTPGGYGNAYASAQFNNVRLVPEPSTLVLLGIAALVLLGNARRRVR